MDQDSRETATSYHGRRTSFEAYLKLIEMAFADYACFARFGVQVVDIEICAYVKSIEMRSKIERCRSIDFAAHNAVEYIARPDQHRGGGEELSVVFHAVRRDNEPLHAAVRGGVEFDVSNAVQDDEVVGLM